jgi:hypothetical protein
MITLEALRIELAARPRSQVPEAVEVTWAEIMQLRRDHHDDGLGFSMPLGPGERETIFGVPVRVVARPTDGKRFRPPPLRGYTMAEAAAMSVAREQAIARTQTPRQSVSEGHMKAKT